MVPSLQRGKTRMHPMTLPLVSFGAAAAAAASIVHFTPGPLPQNRLIAFTGLVAFAALALLVSAWRAGVALVGWWRGGKPQVVEGAVNRVAAKVEPRMTASAETQTAAATPQPPARNAACQVTPGLGAHSTSVGSPMPSASAVKPAPARAAAPTFLAVPSPVQPLAGARLQAPAPTAAPASVAVPSSGAPSGASASSQASGQGFEKIQADKVIMIKANYSSMTPAENEVVITPQREGALQKFLVQVGRGNREDAFTQPDPNRRAKFSKANKHQCVTECKAIIQQVSSKHPSCTKLTFFLATEGNVLGSYKEDEAGKIILDLLNQRAYSGFERRIVIGKLDVT